MANHGNMIMKTTTSSAVLLGLILSSGCITQTEKDPDPVKPAGNAAATAVVQPQAGKGNDIMTLPGLKADRSTKQVWIDAKATGMRAFDPVEFFLIAENSGHGYEALALSLAKPGDIHKALEFIGMKPGKAYDPRAMRYWPKGERVRMTFFAGTNAGIRAERLVADKRAGGPLPETGLVFVGSRMEKDEKTGAEEYAADVRAPNSVAANYNEPTTVLDVPRQALQGDMYRNQTANPDYLFPTSAPLRILLEPEYPDGRQRVLDLLLATEPAEGTEGNSLNEVVFSVSEGRKSRVSKVPLQDALRLFSKEAENGRDSFVQLMFSTALPLKTAKALCGILATIETEKGIRVEPPEPGTLYYKAFMPNDDFRDRSRRPSQPLELYLQLKDGQPVATLVRIDQLWRDDTVYPDLRVQPHPLKGPADMPGKLKELNSEIPVILVFAAENVKLSQLVEFLAPGILKDFPTVHIFLDAAPEPPAAGTIPAPVDSPAPATNAAPPVAEDKV